MSGGPNTAHNQRRSDEGVLEKTKVRMGPGGGGLASILVVIAPWSRSGRHPWTALIGPGIARY